MRIAYDFLPAAAVTVTTGDGAALLSPDYHRWWVAEAAGPQVITLDYGAPVELACLALLGVGLAAGGTVQAEVSADAAFTAPVELRAAAPLDLSLYPAYPTPGGELWPVVVVPAAPVVARHVRWTLTGAEAPKAAAAIAAPLWVPEVLPHGSRPDTRVVIAAEVGDGLPALGRRLLDVEFPFLTPASGAELHAALRRMEQGRRALLIPRPEAPAHQVAEVLLVRRKGRLEYGQVRETKAELYRLTASFEEVLR